MITRRRVTPLALGLVSLAAGCASVIGLDDAAGVLGDGGGGASPSATATSSGANSASSGAGAGGEGGTPAATVGSGGDGGGDGGGGGGAPTPIGLVQIGGSGRITDLQPGAAGDVFVAIDRIEEGGSLATAEWPAPEQGFDRSAVALHLGPSGSAAVERRVDAAGSILDVGSVGVSFGGALLGLAGTFQGTLLAGGAPYELLANAEAIFAATTSRELPYVGITDPEANGGDGVAFLGGRGARATFLGHFGGPVGVGAIDVDYAQHCLVEGIVGQTTLAAFPIDEDCAPDAPVPSHDAGIVVDVASSAARLAVLYRPASTGVLTVALMGADPVEEATVELFAEAMPEARIAPGPADALVGGWLQPGTVEGCGFELLIDAPTAFGARIRGALPGASCDALWADPHFVRAIPVGAVGGSSVYLLDAASDLPAERGWWFAAIEDDLQVARVRRLCASCSPLDVVVSGEYVYVAGLAEAGDTIGGHPVPLDRDFLVQLDRTTLLDGAVAPPGSP